MTHGRFRGRRILGAIVAVVLVLGLSACSNDEPSPPATTTMSPSLQPAETTTTPEVTATRPALPQGQPTEDSAAAFVKYFWAVTNYAYATYDTSLLEAISQPSCKYCSFVINEIHELQKAGSVVSGSEAFIVEVTFLPDEPIVDSAYVLTLSSQRPGSTTTSNRVSKVDGTKNSRIAFDLDWTGGKWLVHGIEIQKKGSRWPA